MFRRRRPQGTVFAPGPDHWELHCRGDYTRLFLAIAEALPAGLTLYVEGTKSPDIVAFLGNRLAPQALHVARGTIWPRAEAYHMPMTGDNVAGFAELMEGSAAPEVADHLHAYAGTTPYLIWYDFPGPPVYLSKGVPEDTVRRMCEAEGGGFSSFV